MQKPRAIAVLMVSGLVACSGNITGSGADLHEGPGPGSGPAQTPGAMQGPGETMAPEPECKPASAPAVGSSPLRRLSVDEYDNTIRDLLGDNTRPGRMLPQEAVTYGFRNNAEAAAVDEDLVDRYRTLAEQIAARAAPQIASLVACDIAALGEQPCAQRFIEKFGLRAWRRPLDKAESDSLLGVYKVGREGGSFATGIELVMQSLLQSAPFLYRVELGVTATAKSNVTRLSSWETASRLSYLLWGSMPDAMLLEAAAAGQLDSSAQLEAQARRMILMAATKAQVANLHAQWLSLDDVQNAEKDKKLFPGYSDGIPALFKQETNRFIDHVLWQSGGGGWKALLTAPFTFADQTLARYYGVAAPANNVFERVSLEGTGRRGLLTQGAFLATQAKANQTSPVLRGKFVRERLLCQTLPPPPPDVEAKAPEPDPQLTTRERFAEHSKQAVCAACHKLMDPIGLGFENFDAAGGWRTAENGRSIDVSGNVEGTDVDGAFVGAADLVERLARSEQVRQCLGLQWFRFSFGRLEAESDACTLAAINGRISSDASVEEILLAVVSSDAFTYRTTGVGQ